jgi:hypothetical protein|nr:MAG TPA: Lysis protein [Caudoviricetes sp.]
MRKWKALAAVVLAALALTGCSSNVISGSVDEVLDKCQDITSNKEVITVKVTGSNPGGYVYEDPNGDYVSVTISNIVLGEVNDPNDLRVVNARFENPNERLIEKLKEQYDNVTVEGTLDVSSITKNDMTLDDCELK